MMTKLCYTDRQKLKDKKFQMTKDIWGKCKFNSPSKVGYTMELIKTLYESNEEKEITRNDWEIYYYKNQLKFKELRKLAREFKNKCKEYGIILSDTDSINYVIIRIIDDSFDGFQKEVLVHDLLQEKYKKCEIKYSVEYDNKYDIDLEMYYQNKLTKTFQVKPLSFYKSLKYKNNNCYRAFERMHKHHLEFKELKGIDTEFVIVDDNNIQFYTYDELMKLSDEKCSA